MTYACKLHTSACGMRHCGLAPLDMTRAQMSHVTIPWWEVLSISLLNDDMQPGSRGLGPKQTRVHTMHCIDTSKLVLRSQPPSHSPPPTACSPFCQGQTCFLWKLLSLLRKLAL